MYKLTYKAIARMCGYGVEMWPDGYQWYFVDRHESARAWKLKQYSGIDSGCTVVYPTEAEAYEACCIVNGLIENS